MKEKLCVFFTGVLIIAIFGFVYACYEHSIEKEQQYVHEDEMLTVVKYVDDNDNHYRIVKYKGNGKMYWQSLSYSNSSICYWVIGGEYTE